jgi:hypothetical protein
VYEGSDVAEYVIACNVTRRNMSTGARAMATALVLEADGRRENGRWKRGSVIQDSGLSNESAWQESLRQSGITAQRARPVLSVMVCFLSHGVFPLSRWGYDR